jgi:hemolysin (HlyC) family protein
MSEDQKNGAASNGQQNHSLLGRLKQSLLNKPFSAAPQDRAQLATVLRAAEKQGLLNHDALAMIEGVLTVSEMQVREVMVPRSQMIVVEESAAPEDFLPLVIESAHSRFPVVGDSRDEIVGILLAKDLLSYMAEREAQSANDDKPRFRFNDLLRPAVIIPESKRLNILLKDFRANRNHMAIVVDEYGGVAGLVTIEDVLEQIVGDIEDEHDFEEDAVIVKHSDSEYTLKALTPIEEFNEYFEAELCDEDVDTVGGLLLREFGRMPERDEKCSIGRFDFTVLRADSRRIHLLQLNISAKNESDEQGSVDHDVNPDTDNND